MVITEHIAFVNYFLPSHKLRHQQVTKAKEIIKNLMVFAEIDSREYEENYKEAEKFLKEVSE
jgi:hypothetical protein